MNLALREDATAKDRLQAMFQVCKITKEILSVKGLLKDSALRRRLLPLGTLQPLPKAFGSFVGLYYVARCIGRRCCCYLKDAVVRGIRFVAVPLFLFSRCVVNASLII